MEKAKGKREKGKGKGRNTASRRRYLLFAFFLFTFSLLPQASPAAVRVYAKVESETAIYPGDTLIYSVVVEGGGKPSKIDISPLAPFNPRKADSVSATQIVNGRTTISYAENFALTAGPAGTMRLPGVTVVADRQTYTTNPVEVTVSQPGTTDRMVLEFSVSEAQCYVGQPLLMTIRWIITARVQQPSFDVPVFKSDDFHIEDVQEPGNTLPREQTTIHGVPITVTESRQLIRGVEGAILSFHKVLIPTRAGRITLDPITVAANLAVGRERTGSFFDPYRFRFERASVQSKPVELNVRPLPEAGKPPQFYGLVGPYTISASAAPTQVNVGDPITLTIRVGGNPFLKPVQWPALEQVPELAAGFKIPAEKASPVLEGGCKVFTQTLRANRDTVTQIPAIPLAYFDPAKGAYVVARTEPIPLQVAPTKVLTNVDVEGTAAAVPVSRDVEAIRKGLSANYYGPEVLEHQTLSVLAILTRPIQVALWSIPLAGLVVSAAVRLAGRTSPETLARKRRRRAAAVALAQLKKLEVLCSRSAVPSQQSASHELLLSALKNYVGDRFDKVAGSLTADDCGRALAEATGDAVTAGRCKELIDACEAARYAPLQAGIGPDQVREAIGLIQAVEKQGRTGRRTEDRGQKTEDGGRKPSRSSVLRRSTSGLPFLLLCLLPVPAAPAAPALPREQLHVLLQEANAAFHGANAAAGPEAGRPLYDKAILLYEKLLEQGGIQNAKLYYNLANAYLLRGLGDGARGSSPVTRGPDHESRVTEHDLGLAILNYRRAARLDRSDVNIQKNLAFARSRRVDRIEVPAERRVLETLFFWHYDFSLPTRLVLACVSFAALCLVLTWTIWRGRGSVTSLAAVLCAVLWLGLLTSGLAETKRRADTREGVITVSQVVARQGDGPNYPPSFKDPLHAGTEFELLEHRPGWLHIRLSDGAEAWIPDTAAGLV